MENADLKAKLGTHHLEEFALKPVLKPIHLWAIAVGMVISGDFFGWNFGLKNSDPVGFVTAIGLVTLLYITFVFSYTELTTAIPNSGGPYAYARRAMGPFAGFIAGFATLIEFVFAPPAIALGIGAYLEFIATTFGLALPPLLSMEPRVWIALLAFALFIGINLRGIKEAVTLELVVTLLAIFVLLVFYAITLPHLKFTQLLQPPLFEKGWGGVFSALPFAIWFYLCIEGVAMSAEETANPRKDVPLGYIAGIGTLVFLTLAVTVCTLGVTPLSTLAEVQYPLPDAAARVLPAGHWLIKMIAVLGVFGLIASFNGIIIGYSRQAFALARAHYLPHLMAHIHPRTQVPHWALILPGIFGMAACLTGFTDQIITISAMGGLVLYIVSMISLFVLRVEDPEMHRPFIAPFYPFFPAVALTLSVLALVTMAWFNALLYLILLGLFALGSLYFLLVRREVESEEELYSVDDFEHLHQTGELPALLDNP
ncbi:ethanolamine permease [bacterium (Candidatus Blackallbacteria) CG17_big_fil_post_rev_8_21_14_2_50_48_46]|uniref:Ethanolamine permease n=1 Tax=bacterium (Candidatus Blackallbacteria) CG17_big_fil_post_rev_8_21_14_2_50_48_46 TaxID=2014261 RepID=A0A2M7G0B9_9BACT|nr:MAG: ethanolamine permease [bacterium (Candidatus Blackallbacteria) CG18_big_fil_WC_8_21_14_2_50_49_26]PIW14629.1 MAG: ethanolamine permease [bacterium (Candidatus Blackallbacteria) CG17_big_fil_post_rev_8_21_14_2_50_48_46]PIW45680.1 MAG: ethanolamine permease [bacterium (Candidatus Blackallbacteria) CG13_big_fil_rev_8_21_14_2_50_49_14]